MKDKNMRDIYCDTLIELAEQDKNIVVLDADLMGANGLGPFKVAFPKNFYNTGVAEANMVGIASGLSAGGMNPFASSFACFSARRAFDQFFVSSNYAKIKVNLTGTDPGISAAYNGGTHMTFEDLGIMRNVPNLVIYEPADIVSLHALVKEAAYTSKSTYLRLHRKGINRLYNESETFTLGKGKVLRDGSDLTIIATGFIMVQEALKAAELLAETGVSAAVVDMHTIQPLDEDLVLQCARKTGAILTCENHQVATGLGSAVSGFLSENYPTPVLRHGIRDEFGEVGNLSYLQERFEFTSEKIAAKAIQVMQLKTVGV